MVHLVEKRLDFHCLRSVAHSCWSNTCRVLIVRKVRGRSAEGSRTKPWPRQALAGPGNQKPVDSIDKYCTNGSQKDRGRFYTRFAEGSRKVFKNIGNFKFAEGSRKVFVA